MGKGTSVLHYTPPTDAVQFSIASAAIKSGSLPEASPWDMDSIQAFEDRYPELKSLSNKGKIEFIRKRRAEIERQFAAEEGIIGEKRTRLGWLRGQIGRIDELTAWYESDLKLEKPEGSSFRKLRKAVAAGNTLYFDKDLYAKAPAHDYEKEVFRHAEILVIEHDWASAFEHANIEDAVIRLPYDVCAFEFKYSGRSVIALATQFGDDIAFTPAIDCGDLWAMFGFVCPASGYGGTDSILHLMDGIAAQIRGACIALDAQVARSDTVREPYVGGHGKNTHLPPRPYHVVSLARRAARALPAEHGTQTGRHVRLHFRRGHWRHFENHKTWINWMLVGDPDLGFVDKHYKL